MMYKDQLCKEEESFTLVSNHERVMSNMGSWQPDWKGCQIDKDGSMRWHWAPKGVKILKLRPRCSESHEKGTERNQVFGDGWHA